MDSELHAQRAAYLQNKVADVTQALNELTPQERAWVLAQANLAWEDQGETQATKMDPTGAIEAGDATPTVDTVDETANLADLGNNEQIMTCLQLIRIFGRLSKSGQQTLMELATEMDDTERFERLIDSGEFEKETE